MSLLTSTVAFLQQLIQSNVFINLNQGKLSVKGNKSALTPDIKRQLGEHKAAILKLYDELNISSNTQLAPLTQSQQRLWFINQIEAGVGARVDTEEQAHAAVYNIPSHVVLAGQLNMPALQATFNTIIERHASLRTTFAVNNGIPYQVIHQPCPLVMPLTDLTDLSGELQQQKVRELLTEEAAKPFCLASDLMLRTQLLRLAADKVVLLYTLHHIASDGWGGVNQ